MKNYSCFYILKYKSLQKITLHQYVQYIYVKQQRYCYINITPIMGKKNFLLYLHMNYSNDYLLLRVIVLL